MSFSQPSFILLADALGNLIGLVLFLVVAGIQWAVAKMREAQANQPRPPGAPPGRQPIAPPARDPKAEVAEFLRRVADLKAGRHEPAREANAPPPPPEPKRAPRRLAPASAPRGDVSGAPAGLAPPQGLEGAANLPSVAQHVAEHVGKKKKRKRLTKLDEVDERVETHVHQVFDHEVGSLSAKAGDATLAAAGGKPAERPAPLAGLIAAMFRDPNNVRSAVILSEVLRRPDDRW